MGFELAVEHQRAGIVARELRPDLLAVGGGLGVGRPFLDRQRPPDRAAGILEAPRTDPAFLDRRVHIGRVGCRAGNPREPVRAIGRHVDRTGFLGEFQAGLVPQLQPRPVEGIEMLENQQRRGLPEISRRAAARAQQIACIKLRNPRASPYQIFRRDDNRGLRLGAQKAQVEAVKDVRGVGDPHKQGVRGIGRPARHVRRPKIRGVKLGAADFCGAINSSDGRGGGILAGSSRQRLPRGEVGNLGRGYTRHGDRNAARSHQLHELPSRRPHHSHLSGLRHTSIRPAGSFRPDTGSWLNAQL